MDYQYGDTFRCPECGSVDLTIYGRTRWMGRQLDGDPGWNDEATSVQITRLWCNFCDEDQSEDDGADLRLWRK